MKPTQLALVIGALCSYEPLYARENRPLSSDIVAPSSNLIPYPPEDPFTDYLLDNSYKDSMIDSVEQETANRIKTIGKFFARSTWFDDFNPAVNSSSLQGRLADNKPHLFWFYRLQRSIFSPLPGDPNLIDPELEGSPPSTIQPAPTLRSPAYATLPAALFGMEEYLQDTFIHDAHLEGLDGRPNFFIYGFNAQERYYSRANQMGSENHYYGWLIGARGLLSEDEDKPLELSVAINKGRLSSNALNSSNARFDMQGINAMLSWQPPRGLQLAMPVSLSQYHGSISSSEKENVAQMKARAGSVGVEGGWRWQLGTHAFTPVAGVTAQWLSMPAIHDKDDLHIRYHQQSQQQFSGGLKYDFAPTASIKLGLETRYVQYRGNKGSVKVDKQDDFTTGRGGKRMQFSGYAGWQVTENMQLNSQIKAQQRLGQEGASSLQTQIGIQFSF